MATHVVFVAPYFMEATLRFVRGTAGLEDVALSLVSADPLEKLPADLRSRLAGHWRVADALDPAQIVHAVRELGARLGPVDRLIASLEQLQVPLAKARATLGLPGLTVDAARNFRDKSQMKDVLRAAGVPCARHRLTRSPSEAREFVASVGYPVVAKPPDGAGGKGTWRLDSDETLEKLLSSVTPTADRPVLFEEFVRGAEHSFDSVMIGGRMVWHSISRYLPSPLEVMENEWIQWSVLLPREIDGPEFDPIRAAAATGIAALGLENGLSHMEWFRLADGRIAISEVGARPPGAQITSLLSYAHDLDFYRAWPRLMVSDRFEPPPRRYAAGAAYVRGRGRGRVKQIHGLEEAQRRFGGLVVEVRLPVRGQPRADGYEGDGFVIVRHPETAVVENALREIVQLVQVELG